MNNDLALKLEGVSKKFCCTLRRSMYYGSIDVARNMFGIAYDSGQLRKNEFWALDNVSFELKRGETLGIIGFNGSGKTTILRLITGIFPPDKGKITIDGRVGSLISVGAGFHPHMTGRENIYLNGTILGMTKKEINKKFDSIVDFAEIGGFLDAPVSTYSSGMHVRLGFAIAIHCEPDVLLVDEILAVGDVAFRAKCYNKIAELLEKCAVIIVSHSMSMIGRVTSRCILLNNGQIAYCGTTVKAIQQYRSLYSEKKFDIYHPLGTGEAKIDNLRFCNKDNIEIEKIQHGKPLVISFDVKVSPKYKTFLVSITFLDEEEQLVFQCHSGYNGVLLESENTSKIKITIPSLLLNPGNYAMNIIVFDKDNQKYLAWLHKTKDLKVEGEFVGGAPGQFIGTWEKE